MKTIKFWKVHKKKIIRGEKTTTHRLFDDKNIQVGDELEFIVTETGEPFGRARVVDIAEKKLGELTVKDWEGHEKFSSDKEMYETYSKYYDRKVGPHNIVKIIQFKLLR